MSLEKNSEYEKYKDMPNIKNRYSMSSYEKLYFLLALVDTLEPTKRGINLKDIDIDVYLAFIILFNFSDDDVIFFFSDYYSNYCEFDESTNYLYKLSALYLDIDE